MKKYLLLTFFYISLSFSQNESIKGIVYYGEFNCIQCGAKNGKEYIGNLIFDNKESFYSQNDTLIKQLNKNIDNKNFYSDSNDGGVFYPNEDSYNLDDFSHYQVHTNKDSVYSYFIYSSPTYGDVHYVKEKKEKINWQLNNERKKIGDFECLKATGKFRGRTYTAWYTLKIPVPYGPWKLQGLPGLILEAYNENESIYYFAKKIEYPFNEKKQIPNIILPVEAKWHTFKESLNIMEVVLQESYERALLIAEKMSGIKIRKQNIKDVFNEFDE